MLMRYPINPLSINIENTVGVKSEAHISWRNTSPVTNVKGKSKNIASAVL
jgi:hypothetical protein